MIADTPAVESAHREWRAALDRLDDHRQQCDSYVVSLPCGGCTVFLSREQSSHGRFIAARRAGGVL